LSPKDKDVLIFKLLCAYYILYTGSDFLALCAGRGMHDTANAEFAVFAFIFWFLPCSLA